MGWEGHAGAGTSNPDHPPPPGYSHLVLICPQDTNILGYSTWWKDAALENQTVCKYTWCRLLPNVGRAGGGAHHHGSNSATLVSFVNPHLTCTWSSISDNGFPWVWEYMYDSCHPGQDCLLGLARFSGRASCQALRVWHPSIGDAGNWTSDWLGEGMEYSTGKARNLQLSYIPPPRQPNAKQKFRF